MADTVIYLAKRPGSDNDSVPLLLHDNGDGTYSLGTTASITGGGDASAANQATQITAEQAIQAAIGATTDAAVTTDANGTVNAHMRGALVELIALLATAGAAGDAAVSAGATGSINAHLRSISRDLVANIVLAAGTNAIGKLAANSGVDIGDVDITSIAAGENHLGAIGGAIVRVTGTFTRPADTTAYAANDIVSNSTGGSTLVTLSNALRVNAGTGYIVGCRVATNKKSITPRIRVHVYNASNPTVSVDNAAAQFKYADISKRVGSFDLPAMSTGADTTNSDMSAATDWTLRIPTKAAASDTALYVLLETLDAYTPASGDSYTVELLIDQN